jgi:hypothetical protein
MPKIGFGDVEVRTFEPLPRGRYLSKMTAAEFVPESKRSGEPSIAWEFTVNGGEYNNRKGFLNTSLQDQSLWATQRMLMALGMSKEEVDGLEWDTDDPDTVQSTLNDLIGNDCVIVIRLEKFEGEDRQRISRVLTADQVQGVANAEGGEKAKF